MKGIWSREDRISRAIVKLKEIHNSVLDSSASIKSEMAKVSKLSEPFMQQVGGENVCRSNIENTISSIQEILDEIKEVDALILQIKSKFILLIPIEQ